MKQFLLNLLLFAFISIGLISCKKDKSTVPDVGYNYFPTQVGRYVIYDVDSTYYDSYNISQGTHLAAIHHYKFQLKEKIESIFSDNQNRPTVRLERYIRFPDSTMAYTNVPWTLHNVWAENRTATTAEKVEDNVRIVKLIFPVKQGAQWDADAQNTVGSAPYSYDYIDMPKSFGAFAFDSVLQVNQKQLATAITNEYSVENYARNVGLVYKQEIKVQSQYPNSWPQLAATHDTTYYDSIRNFLAIPIMQRITGGYPYDHQYSWTINSYGIE